MGDPVSHGPCDFKKRNVRVAVEAAREAGLEVARVEIGTDGKIVIVAGKPGENADNESAPKRSEWDKKYGDH
jgi:hypothetical protein